MKSKIITLTILLTATFLISSCQREKSLDGIAINLYGGTARTNNYEEFGNFYNQLVLTDIPPANDSSGAISAPISISSANTIIATIGGSIVSIYKDRKEWEYKLPQYSVIAANMATDAKHNIYALDNDGNLFSISLGGALRWQKKIFTKKEVLTTFSDLLSTSDGVVAASSNGEIKKIDFDGNIKWSVYRTLSTTQFFPSDEKGNIALPLTHDLYGKTDSLLLLNKDGQTTWQIALDSFRIAKSPVMFQGKIYLIGLKENNGNKIGTLFCIDMKGKIIWKKEINMHTRFISIANDGKIYVSAYNAGIAEAYSAVYCLNKNGNMLWSKFFEVAIPNPIMLSEDKLAFLASDKHSYSLFFLNKQGFVERTVSLADTYLFRSQPVVSPGSNIILAGSERLLVIRLDDTPMNKMIPW
jgi:outer membrane protein assembly factor BamB